MTHTLTEARLREQKAQAENTLASLLEVVTADITRLRSEIGTADDLGQLERLKGQRDAFTYVRDFLLCHGVKCSAT